MTDTGTFNYHVLPVGYSTILFPIIGRDRE